MRGDDSCGYYSNTFLRIRHLYLALLVYLRTLFDLNIKDVSQCVMPGVKKSNDVELQLHESDAMDQTEVSHYYRGTAPLGCVIFLDGRQRGCWIEL